MPRATRATPAAATDASRAAASGMPSGRVGGRFWSLTETDDEDDEDGGITDGSPDLSSPTPSDVICEAFSPSYSEEDIATIFDVVVPSDDLARQGLRSDDKIELVRRIVHKRTAPRHDPQGYLQSYRMDPYVVLTQSYGLQGAFGYWVHPVGDGSTGYIQPVRMAVT